MKKKPLPIDEIKRKFTCCVSTGRLFHKTTGKRAGWYNKGYRCVKLNRQDYKEHRVIYWFATGKDPGELQIDHINGSTDDNRFENLRRVNHAENHKNRRLSRNNKSGFPGVFFVKENQKWRVFIGGRPRKHLGYFVCLGQAIKHRKDQQQKMNYHENHGKSRPAC